MDNSEITEKLENYIETLKQYFKVKLIVLFGSYAKGNSKKYSDIDIAVFVEKDENEFDYLEKSALLLKLVRKIDVRIEPTLFYSEELKDYEKASFVNEILTTGEIIYQNWYASFPYPSPIPKSHLQVYATKNYYPDYH